MTNKNLNRFSSSEDKNSAAEVVYEVLGDFLFDKVNFLNNPGNSTSNGVTSTTTYGAAVRVPDTGAGKYLLPNKKTRLRTVFYIFGDAENADAYILTQCMYQGSTLAAFTSVESTFSYYVGIKINRGAVSLVSKSSNGMNEVRTEARVIGATTYKLEMLFNVLYTEVYIDDNYIGSISHDYSSATETQITLYPLIAPIRSIAGTSVEMDLENYQILQDK
jgi:hypothetical protein